MGLHHSESSLSSQTSLISVPSLSQRPLLESSATRSQCVATLNGHSSYVFSFALAGKNVLYSGCSNGEVRVWSRNIPTDHHGDIVSSIDDHIVVASGGASVKSLVVLEDNKVISAHQDHKIRVWEISTEGKFKCLATLPTLNDRFTRLFSTKNYVQIRRHCKQTWVHHVDTVSALAVSTHSNNNKSLLYSASWDRSFKIWRTSDFKCVESVERAHDDAINAIVVSQDGFIYTGSADKKIKVWKNFPGQKKHILGATLERHRSAINALALSTDGSILYSGACDRSILVWERDKQGDRGEMLVSGALRGHTKAILCLGVEMDLVCSGSADNTIRIWRRMVDNSYSCLAVLESHRKPVKCLAVAMDHTNNNKTDSESGTSYILYTGSLDCDIKVWQIWVPGL
ncbi:hypothetical protein ACFE04_024468 [Oxalis oulophora]